jgi:hypothetical protein
LGGGSRAGDDSDLVLDIHGLLRFRRRSLLGRALGCGLDPSENLMHIIISDRTGRSTSAARHSGCLQRHTGSRAADARDDLTGSRKPLSIAWVPGTSALL